MLFRVEELSNGTVGDRPGQSLGTVDLKDAKLKLAGWLMTGGAMVREPASIVPLETVLVRYYEHHVKRLAKRAIRRSIRLRSGPISSRAPWWELTPDRQRAFIASLRNQSYSEGYIRRVLQIGQAALNRALREGEIAIAPKVLVGEAPEARRVNAFCRRRRRRRC
jgi:hypothetical protein